MFADYFAGIVSEQHGLFGPRVKPIIHEASKDQYYVVIIIGGYILLFLFTATGRVL